VLEVWWFFSFLGVRVILCFHLFCVILPDSIYLFKGHWFEGMMGEAEGRFQKVVFYLDSSTAERIGRIVDLLGFKSREDFVRSAVRREVDYYSLLLRCGGAGEK
jgi:hypothetical protein